ncbi:carbohydrate ABC transporter permease [Actinomyces mediterranea]|uniref:carbohydrate ABC transporter permease n=1 Tax=Actinomyces mediterranea TaxID=1871028 RepID=UPI0009F896B0|nr:sugar ABC transporter permease [Actinomyces mediterranea]
MTQERRFHTDGVMIKRRSGTGWALTSPAILIVGAVMFFPLVYLLSMSFTEYAPMRSETAHFVGVENYLRIASDDLVVKSLRVTLIFTFASVALEMLIGLVCALGLAHIMMHAQGRFGVLIGKVLASSFILPFAIPAVAGAFAWKMLLDAQFGPVNALLGTHTPWLVEHPIVSIIIIDAWKMMPFVLFVLLAAILSIDQSQFEAAELDGAGPWITLWSITMPSILPVFLVTAAFRAVDAFTKVFDTVFVTTGGGPGTDTQVIPLLIWKTAFTNLDYGRAAALALVAMVVSFAFGSILLKRKTEQ